MLHTILTRLFCAELPIYANSLRDPSKLLHSLTLFCSLHQKPNAAKFSIVFIGMMIVSIWYNYLLSDSCIVICRIFILSWRIWFRSNRSSSWSFFMIFLKNCFLPSILIQTYTIMLSGSFSFWCQYHTLSSGMIYKSPVTDINLQCVAFYDLNLYVPTPWQRCILCLSYNIIG